MDVPGERAAWPRGIPCRDANGRLLLNTEQLVRCTRLRQAAPIHHTNGFMSHVLALILPRFIYKLPPIRNSVHARSGYPLPKQSEVIKQREAAAKEQAAADARVTTRRTYTRPPNTTNSHRAALLACALRVYAALRPPATSAFHSRFRCACCGAEAHFEEAFKNHLNAIALRENIAAGIDAVVGNAVSGVQVPHLDRTPCTTASSTPPLLSCGCCSSLSAGRRGADSP